jgi:hypothetical protein
MRLKMFGPKGLGIASWYFLTRLVLGHSARVIVKLEDNGDHYHPARIEIGGVAPLTACLRHTSMAFTIV